MVAPIVEAFSLSHAQVLDGNTAFLTALAAAAAVDQDIYGVNDSSMDPDTGDYDNEGDDAVLSTWSWFNFADIAIQAGYLSFPLIERITNQTASQGSAVAAVNEVQTVTITGTPTGGTFTLTFDGETTAAIAFNANAAAVQTALLALTNLDTGDVTVTGGPGPGTPYVITFGADYAGQNVGPVTASGAGLTGGTTPAVTVAQTTPGSAASASSFGLDLWHEDSMNVAPKPLVVRMPSKDAAGNVKSLAIGLYRVQFKPLTFDGPTYKDGLKINYNGRAVMSSLDETGATFSDGKKRVGRILSFT
jgi:hypothetical protein